MIPTNRARIPRISKPPILLSSYDCVASECIFPAVHFSAKKNVNRPNSCLTAWIGFQSVVSVLSIFVEIVQVSYQTGMLEISVMDHGNRIFL